jgi:hypothetical protein
LPWLGARVGDGVVSLFGEIVADGFAAVVEAVGAGEPGK